MHDVRPPRDDRAVQTMRAVRKLAREPGLVLDEVPVPAPGVLCGIPARPVEIDIAESLIFENLTVTAVDGREVWATWYRMRWLLEHGVVDPRPFITAELPPERFDEAFAVLAAGDACKIVLRTGA